MSEITSNLGGSQTIRAGLPGREQHETAQKLVLLNLASRWKRLAAAFIDCFFAVIVMVPLLLIAGVFPQAANGQQVTLGQQIVIIMIGWAVFLIMNGYLLNTKGQTLGKAAVNIKMVDAEGNVPSFGKLLGLRYLLPALVAYIPLVGGLLAIADALFIFSQDKRCLHDQLAGTWVVNEL